MCGSLLSGSFVWHKAVTYMRAFQHMHMSRQEATVHYRSCFLPALTYSFPATWMPQAFLECIHRLLMSTILNKMGLHCHLMQSIVFAPQDLGGVMQSHTQTKCPTIAYPCTPSLCKDTTRYCTQNPSQNLPIVGQDMVACPQ